MCVLEAVAMFILGRLNLNHVLLSGSACSPC